MPVNPNLTSHKQGFKSVSWYGREYKFNAQQAACVSVLWRNWLGGTPIVREALVLEMAGVDARSLKDLFRAPPGRDAWGTLIGNGDRRGTVRLLDPEGTVSAGGPVGPPPLESTATSSAPLPATAIGG